MIFLKIESVIAFFVVKEGLAFFVKLVFEESVGVVEYVILIPERLEFCPMGFFGSKHFIELFKISKITDCCAM